MSLTRVHLARHGEVHNPGGILYGRLPGFGLSEQGTLMAERLGEYFADVPLRSLTCSPLQRTQETIAPVAARHPDLGVTHDERVIETSNVFQGTVVRRELTHPTSWRHLLRPWRPSWGEAYTSIAARMRDAIADVATAHEGEESLIVSHQLPIWIARLDAEGRPFVHDPRHRECSLASVTTFVLDGPRIVRVEYAEPARDLLRAGVPHA
ncbi:histidine phosphatase family protein [Propionicicella superfundia]|uniref:histidine phosphatase family protein n=1 Tax=Propionicicella superfundia TaxID=348582 RepID=UPI0003FEF555|nr:histidine phosphatase family protein [Propionicicella superfundia]